MTITAALPLLVGIAGAVIYLVLLKASRESFAELSRIAWACGLLVFLFSLAWKVVKF